MDSLNLNKHISGQFNAELESIRTQVMTMGGMVEQQLSDAITAMHNQDSDLAKRVIEGDKNVNMMEVAIDEACVRIIAKRQPTASDLRLVMVISKTIAELERIGDVADKICRTALEKFSQQHQPLLVSLESLGRHTIQMLHDVLDAFARMDIDQAVRIYREDKKVSIGSSAYSIKIGLRSFALSDDLSDDFIEFIKDTFYQINKLFNREKITEETRLKRYIVEWWKNKTQVEKVSNEKI